MTINSKVSEFLDKIQQGVRPNMFLCDFEFPNNNRPGTTELDLVNIMCKSAALPASNLGVIEVPFRGRTVKIAGDRTFDTWTATFINDKDFKIRQFMEKWMENINKHDDNTAVAIVPEVTTGYTGNILVKQLERDNNATGSILRQYKLWDVFPTNISQIDLAYDSNDQIEDFTVEFQLQYWTVDSGVGRGANGGIA